METSGGMKERLLFGYWRCGIKWQCFLFLSYLLLLYFPHCFSYIVIFFHRAYSNMSGAAFHHIDKTHSLGFKICLS